MKIICATCLTAKIVNVVNMICLDPKNRIINQEMLFEGSFESVELDVAKVLRSAVKK